jgi:hypothetical protein
MLNSFAPEKQTNAARNFALPRALVEKRLPHEFAVEIDTDGSPVSVPPADWFVCFVPGLQRQWWHRFANASYQHVFAMRMVDDDTWIIVEPWWTRMLVTVLTLDEAVKFLRWGASGNILQVREAVPGHGNQVRGWANCAVLTAFLLGRSYRTWTPYGLYQRLVKDSDARPVDLTQWLADHVRHVAARNADRALESVQLIEGQSVRTALLQLGSSIMGALMSRSSVALYKLAVSESSRFSEAAHAYWEEAPKRAMDAVLEVLRRAQLRGEIDIDDPDAVARQFVAMLRGDLHLEILFGLRQCPGSAETHIRVKSAVDLLLGGARASDRTDSPVIAACVDRRERHAYVQKPA